MQYDETANGKEVEVRDKDDIQISLPEVSTAGYHWVEASEFAPVLRLQEELRVPNTSGVGGSGQHVWRIQAAAPGTTNVEFHYIRSWEKAAQRARTFKMKIRVRP